ncbi:hypothetical protein, partial [Elstera litoralis]|uniref:hypothetical protein n=1 Tax=Elstera litoralis TaxID=552518 RepID=UPI001E30BF28
QRNKTAPALHAPHGMPGSNWPHSDKSMPYLPLLILNSVTRRKIQTRNTGDTTKNCVQARKSLSTPLRHL